MNPIKSINSIKVCDLFARDIIFKIPFFQRDYVWNYAQMKSFFEELSFNQENENQNIISTIYINEIETEFGEPNIYEIIDGQQRIITIYISLVSFANFFTTHDPEFAEYIVNKFLHVNSRTLKTNYKIMPSINDVYSLSKISVKLFENFNKVIYDQDKNLYNSSNIEKNYNTINKFIKDIYKEIGELKIKQMCENLLNNYYIIFSELNTNIDNHRLFDQINSNSILVTPFELFKNSLFMKIKDKPIDQIIGIYNTYWIPFESKFINKDQDKFIYLFAIAKGCTYHKSPYQFILELFNNKDIIKSIQILDQWANYYHDLRLGTSYCELPIKIKDKIHDLYLIHSPDSLAILIIKIIFSYMDKVLNLDETLKILTAIECFIFRRSACGYDTTGIGNITRSMLKIINSDFTANHFIEFLIEKNINIVGDLEFKTNITAKIPNRRFAVQYILIKYEQILSGEIPTNFKINKILTRIGNKDVPNIEYWETQLGNLVLSDSKLPDSSYETKRALLSAQRFRSSKLKYVKFGYDEIKLRSMDINEFAMEYFKYNI